MNFLARAFQRSRGTQPSVSASAVDGQTISTSLGTDRIDIRATALNRGGYAEAIGLDDSTVSTLAGDDNVRIHAQARGLSTNAWAMRNSSLETDSGNDTVHLSGRPPRPVPLIPPTASTTARSPPAPAQTTCASMPTPAATPPTPLPPTAPSTPRSTPAPMTTAS